MILLTKELVPQAEFLVGDIENLELDSMSFGAIWASASLLHIPKQAMPDVLSNLHRILKPGGIFYLSMKQGNHEELTPDDRYGGVEKFWNYVSKEELSELLSQCGFQILKLDVEEKSTLYQTHQWISAICQKP